MSNMEMDAAAEQARLTLCHYELISLLEGRGGTRLWATGPSTGSFLWGHGEPVTDMHSADNDLPRTTRMDLWPTLGETLRESTPLADPTTPPRVAYLRTVLQDNQGQAAERRNTVALTRAREVTVTLPLWNINGAWSHAPGYAAPAETTGPDNDRWGRDSPPWRSTTREDIRRAWRGNVTSPQGPTTEEIKNFTIELIRGLPTTSNQEDRPIREADWGDDVLSLKCTYFRACRNRGITPVNVYQRLVSGGDPFPHRERMDAAHVWAGIEFGLDTLPRAMHSGNVRDWVAGHTGNAAPGPDGIPFEAYRQEPSTAERASTQEPTEQGEQTPPSDDALWITQLGSHEW
jgi:hypothetical protein